MSAGIIEFLNELNESESLATLNEASRLRSPFVYKLAEIAQPCIGYIESFIDRRVVLSAEGIDASINLNQDITIKFNVGTEVYFVKTRLRRHLNKVSFDMNVKVLQLKRRKEPRFLIPSKWNQTASFICLDRPKFVERVKCQIIDISFNGIRIEYQYPQLKFVRDNELKIQFQIYKRAEVEVQVQTRFFLDKNDSAIMGCELYNMKPQQTDKISLIIEDIQNYQILQKK